VGASTNEDRLTAWVENDGPAIAPNDLDSGHAYHAAATGLGEYAVGDKYNTRYVVAQIRKKLGDDPANPCYIVNEPGVGYRLTAPDGSG